MSMTLRLPLIAAFGLWLAAPAWSEVFFFSNGNPDALVGAVSQRPSPGRLEAETADDFVLLQTTAISGAAITGLIVPNATPVGNISHVEVELYHIFPLDSDTSRTIQVLTRTNSPADVEIDTATRDSIAGTLSFFSTLLNPNFTVTNSVVNGINKSPNQHTGGEGPKTGQEVAITIQFTTPIILPAGHYFFRPEVQVTNGDFLFLSAPKPIVSPGTPFPAGVTDLQAWIRNSSLAPDWSRIGSDIIGTPAAGPTFNMTFSLSGNTIPAAGEPGQANCHGKTVSALALGPGGMSEAAGALGAASVDALQTAIRLYCGS
jgi:hypothetical protein